MAGQGEITSFPGPNPARRHPCCPSVPVLIFNLPLPVIFHVWVDPGQKALGTKGSATPWAPDSCLSVAGSGREKPRTTAGRAPPALCPALGWLDCSQNPHNLRQTQLQFIHGPPDIRCDLSSQRQLSHRLGSGRCLDVPSLSRTHTEKMTVEMKKVSVQK